MGAVTELADHDQLVVSGRISTATQGWLGGHRVHDTVLFPGTGFIDVALHAGERAGCPVIEELVIHTPMVLAEQAPTDIQIMVEPADAAGRRAFSVHARPGAQPGSSVWTLHANGTLRAEPAERADPPAMSPPPGTPEMGVLDPDSFYDQLATHGLGYGGPFRSLRGIGQDPADPDTVHAEIELPPGTDTSGYGIHPALLDAALHPLTVFFATSTNSEPVAPRLPFVFSGISLAATGATRLQIQLTRIGVDTFRLHAADPAGATVISIEAVTVRELPTTLAHPLPRDRLQDGLLELAWTPLPELPAPHRTRPDLDAHHRSGVAERPLPRRGDLAGTRPPRW